VRRKIIPLWGGGGGAGKGGKGGERPRPNKKPRKTEKEEQQKEDEKSLGKGPEAAEKSSEGGETTLENQTTKVRGAASRRKTGHVIELQTKRKGVG